jgi:hypothetical protein
MLVGLPHIEVVGWGGIYSHQPNCSRWRRLLAMGAPDSPLRHRTVSGAPRRHPVVRAWSWSPLEALSSCGTGQSGALDQGTLRFPLCSFLLKPNLFFLLVCVEPLAPVECMI